MGVERLLDLYGALSNKAKAVLWGTLVLAVIAVLDFALRLNLSDLVDVSSTISSLFTVAALVIGGAWTYLLFVRTRQRYPRASLEHRIVHKKIDDSKTLLRVTLAVSNQGDVLLAPVSGFVRIQQMVPWPPEVLEADPNDEGTIRKGETEVDWPLLKEYVLSFEESDREIEPGEPDEFHFDFAINGGVETILAYTYISNKQKRGRDIGWGLTTVHDLRG